jgi:2-dehydropantoate 2-reductase
MTLQTNTLNSVHILGQGAIGSLLTSRALRNNIKVSCEVRKHTGSPVSVVDLDGIETKLPLPTQEQRTVPTNSLVILPLKAYHITQALQSLQNRLHANCAVMLLHNGIVELASDMITHLPCPVYLATTSHAAKRKENKVFVTGTGHTYFGSSASSVDTGHNAHDDIYRLLNLLIGPTIFDADIKRILWRKLIVNAAINPLTGIHRIKNGELENETFTQLIVNIIRESICVAKHDNIDLDQYEMNELVFQVIRDTANNHSSMYQDIAYGRPTEIAYINGYIVNRGVMHGVSTPFNSSLLSKIIMLSTQQ